ncbi:26S proteasome non-ATPase regulatory subunit 4 [Tanacetum coccineum]|uniref:26S proteasome non-ATPase regulatory subunit 4 n=1 Tax=Tanacetum coccineum TaxID=301880 RepID=A0ABQ5AT77_9ASTR
MSITKSFAHDRVPRELQTALGHLKYLCMDRMDRFLDQADAIELYSEKKLKSHPDNLVGIFAMGATGFGSVVEPTQSLSKIMHGVLGFKLVGAHTALRHALGLAQFRWFDFKKEHKYKNLLKRIVASQRTRDHKYKNWKQDKSVGSCDAYLGQVTGA